ncbi:hypothetical protein ACTJKO_01455 [Curtobacterium sp. 22159]|uniref:hypothetical protein n=1 Tax=Curtobacterium sp. 22159 TaxID=3453882 RepID=UPI003F84CCC0
MSKYLPPFTAEERVTAEGDRPERVPADPSGLPGEPSGLLVEPSGLLVEPTGSEVTYADFLGDEVDE